MIKNNIKKLIFVNVLLVFAFILSVVNKTVVLAGNVCTAGEVVDYLIERSNLGIFEDNSFEGKKKGLNVFGIKGLGYLTSQDESMTVEKLASVCVDIMSLTKEDEQIIKNEDNTEFGIMDPGYFYRGRMIYSSDSYGEKNGYIRSLDPLAKEFNERALIKKHGRINDIKSADKIHILDLITVFKKGIIIGKSLGQYSQKRNINPKRKVSLSEAKKVIERVYDRKKRYPMSPDGQLIRKTNLPVNAAEYKYILAAFPNSFYETRFMYETLPSSYKTLHEDYDKPKRIFDEYCYGVHTYENLFDEAEKMRKFQDHRFNVDYRTIDKKWGKKLLSFYILRHDKNEDLKNIKKDINNYIKFVKENKIIIEAKPSPADPSAFFYLYGDIYMHTPVNYRIVSCKNLDKNFNHIIYGCYIDNVGFGFIRHYKEKIVLGKWMSGVYDILYPKRTDNRSFYDIMKWRYAGDNIIGHLRRNIKKKKILQQFRITPKDKLWVDPDFESAYYGWK